MTKRKIHLLSTAAILLVLSVFAYKSSFLSGPSGRHAWTQADRLGIALNYAEPNANLFKPKSFVLNPPSPPQKALDTLEGITRIDFPLSEYLAGCIMNFSHCKEPVIFRLFTLILSLIGLLFLFRLLITNNIPFQNALLAVLFIFSLPVYMYYQCSFLPVTSAAGLAFIAYFYYFRYLQGKKFANFIVATSFLFTAVLFRLPFIIPLLAVIAQQGLSYLLNKKIQWKEIAVFACVFALLIAYYLYNSRLQQKYGAIFLSSFMHAASVKEFFFLMGNILRYQMWLRPILIIHIVLIIFLLTNFFIKYKAGHKNITDVQKFLLIQGGITFAGGFCYFIIMQQQFIQHDYYFLDTFLVASVLILAFLFSIVNSQNKKRNILVHISLFVLISVALFQSIHFQKRIFSENFTPDFEQNVQDMRILIDRNHIALSEKIAIPDENYPANLAFCYIRRHGFGNYNNLREYLPQADYILITQKSFEEHFRKEYLEFLDKLKVVDSCKTALLFQL